MIKDGNTRIVITLSEQLAEVLENMAYDWGETKSQLISYLIQQEGVEYGYIEKLQD